MGVRRVGLAKDARCADGRMVCLSTTVVLLQCSIRSTVHCIRWNTVGFGCRFASGCREMAADIAVMKITDAEVAKELCRRALPVSTVNIRSTAIMAQSVCAGLRKQHAESPTSRGK